MLRSFLTLAYRNFVRNKFFSTINLIGLSFGIACCIIIFNYIAHELSYEKPHTRADKIFRALTQGSQTETLAVTADILSPTKINFLK